MASPSASDGYQAVEGWAPFTDWTLLEVTGRDSERFLQSQLTSDVCALRNGRSQLSALLDRTGRLQAMLFVLRTANGFDLLVPDAAVDAVSGHFDRFIIADDVEVRRVPAADARLTLGPVTWGENAAEGRARRFPLAAYGSYGCVTWDGAHPEASLLATGELHALAVLSGFPRWGRDVNPGQLVTETRLSELAVSQTKGCFLGQETVAKILSHRGPARYPVLLAVDEDVDIDGFENSQVTIDGRVAGTVLAVTRWGDMGVLQVALGRESRVAGRRLHCIIGADHGIDAEVLEGPPLQAPTVRERSEWLFHAAVAQFEANDEGAAVRFLERAIEEDPGHGDAYETLGVILGRQGRFDEAIGWMKRLLEIDPGSVMAHTNMSLYHNKMGRIEDAEREARAAAAKRLEQERQDRANLDAAVGDVTLDRERRHEMFSEVLAIDPEDAVALFGMGELLLELGKPDGAAACFESALRSDPKMSAAFVGWGRALEEQKRLPEAVDVYRRGLDVAASGGDLKAANRMQERLSVLLSDS